MHESDRPDRRERELTVECVLAVVDVQVVGLSVEHEAALGDPVGHTPDQRPEVRRTVLFEQRVQNTAVLNEHWRKRNACTACSRV